MIVRADRTAGQSHRPRCRGRGSEVRSLAIFALTVNGRNPKKKTATPSPAGTAFTSTSGIVAGQARADLRRHPSAHTGRRFAVSAPACSISPLYLAVQRLAVQRPPATPEPGPKIRMSNTVYEVEEQEQGHRHVLLAAASLASMDALPAADLTTAAAASKRAETAFAANVASSLYKYALGFALLSIACLVTAGYAVFYIVRSWRHLARAEKVTTGVGIVAALALPFLIFVVSATLAHCQKGGIEDCVTVALLRGTIGLLEQISLFLNREDSQRLVNERVYRP